MHALTKTVLSPFLLAAVFCLGGGAAQAQYMTLVGAGTIALKSNETIELGEAYYVSNCRSMLKSTPEVQVLDGPSEISVAIKEEMVLPRRQGCAKKVSGGVLTISAKDIFDPSFTRLTLRVLYKTKDGERSRGNVFQVSLFP